MFSLVSYLQVREGGVQVTACTRVLPPARGGFLLPPAARVPSNPGPCQASACHLCQTPLPPLAKPPCFQTAWKGGVGRGTAGRTILRCLKGLSFFSSPQQSQGALQIARMQPHGPSQDWLIVEKKSLRACVCRTSGSWRILRSRMLMAVAERFWGRQQPASGPGLAFTASLADAVWRCCVC